MGSTWVGEDSNYPSPHLLMTGAPVILPPLPSPISPLLTPPRASSWILQHTVHSYLRSCMCHPGFQVHPHSTPFGGGSSALPAISS